MDGFIQWFYRFQFLLLKFSNITGLLFEYTHKASGITVSLRQELRYYISAISNGQASGAYIFRPSEQRSYPLNDALPVTIRVVILKNSDIYANLLLHSSVA